MGMEANGQNPWRDYGGSAAVYADGKPVFEHASGLADTARGAANTLGTAFRCASVGKQFVAASVMLLVEAGQVDLHAPIARYLPECPAAWSEITPHQLLSHTAGLGHWREVEGFDPRRLFPPEEILRRRALRPLIAKPGTEFGYSGVGYLLAANIVEQVAAQSYAAFTAERIFAPLDMDSTRAGVSAPGPEAIGHVAGEPVDSSSAGAVPGTGAVWTTVGDLARYAAAFAADELLSASSRALMCAAHAPVPAGEGQFGETVGYGYGYFTGTIEGRPMHYHPGDIPGYRSMYVSVSGARAVIVLLSNQEETDPPRIVARLWAERFHGS